MTLAPAESRSRARSVGAVLLGFVAVFVLSLGSDQILHVLKVYPPWDEPMWDPKLNLLALSYRLVYGVVGSYLTARFAPHSPMKHAMTVGVVGFVLSCLGAIAAIKMEMGPMWYPILLALSALPCAWLGGVLERRWNT